MRHWTRSLRLQLCDYCHAYIQDGDPLLEIRLNGVRRETVRCVACAGPAPPDLPVYERQTTKPMTHLKKALPKDFKLAQGGD